MLALMKLTGRIYVHTSALQWLSMVARARVPAAPATANRSAPVQRRQRLSRALLLRSVRVHPLHVQVRTRINLSLTDGRVCNVLCQRNFYVKTFCSLLFALCIQISISPRNRGIKKTYFVSGYSTNRIFGAPIFMKY